MRNYRLLSTLLSPLVTLWIYWRMLGGKEDGRRIKERFGHAGAPRPEGSLLWLHAASVGEANSVLLLIGKLRTRFPGWKILLTTGTVTSARLMRMRLPADVIHQFVPVDTPAATQRFIDHWRPDVALWVESEFWPNLVAAANQSQCFMGVINARLSSRSLRGWQRHAKLAREMLSGFDVFFAQSEEDAKRLAQLGAKSPECVGNLKYDASLLPCDEAELIALKNTIGARPIWLAASTHKPEETIAGEVHSLLRATRPNLLTIIVPRHPPRGPEIAAALASIGKVTLRSRKEPIAPDTAFYVADTLGELGLFYRLCERVFMGGSLARHGGQNPLEPARLSCGIIAGPHTHNFAGIYEEMEKGGMCWRVHNPAQLAGALDKLFRQNASLHDMQARVRPWIEAKGGAAKRLLEALSPIFETGRT